MAQGRGSCFTLRWLMQPTTYVVGDAAGWTFNVNNWPNGKSFMAGDILEFRYNRFFHNVLQVSAEGYKRCIPTLDSKLYWSGDDHIQLNPGLNYFICGFPFHCLRGMKLAINASH
ncbi:hypothetical protein CR513_44053, partial [Mucuna pruriens]